jgi:hypothetical protein
MYFDYFIRDNQLHMLVSMRSNDFFWGFTGSDCFTFTMFHEYMLCRLKSTSKTYANLALGHYYHHASSFHIYDDMKPHVEALLTVQPTSYDIVSMPQMPEGNIDAQIKRMIMYEYMIRTSSISQVKHMTFDVDSYWQDLLNMLRIWRLNKEHHDFIEIYDQLSDIWQQQVKLYFHSRGHEILRQLTLF